MMVADEENMHKNISHLIYVHDTLCCYRIALVPCGNGAEEHIEQGRNDYSASQNRIPGVFWNIRAARVLTSPILLHLHFDVKASRRQLIPWIFPCKVNGVSGVFQEATSSLHLVIVFLFCKSYDTKGTYTFAPPRAQIGPLGSS